LENQLQSSNQLPENKSINKEDNYLVIERKSNRRTRAREIQIQEASKRIEEADNGLKREPATHPKFFGNLGDSDRLACAPHRQGDGTVHLGLPSQCSEGPCSNRKETIIESNRWRDRGRENQSSISLSLTISLLIYGDFSIWCSALALRLKGESKVC